MNYGCIENIFHVTQNQNYLLKVNVLQNIHFDSLQFNGKTYFNEHIIFGEFIENCVEIIPASSIIEKGCFFHGDNSYFARFPNMYESS